MQIFCDESGGADKGVLLVASVCVDAHTAERTMKDFRRRFRLRDEIKGSSLTNEQRAHFFSLLCTRLDGLSVVVGCSRAEQLGAWAFGAVSEAEIYERLMFESCGAHDPSGQQSITVRPDGGKYSHEVMRGIEARLGRSLSEHFSARVTVHFANSTSTHGVQMSDIISNTVYRAITSGCQDLREDEFCTELAASGRLLYKGIDFGESGPHWLTP